MLKWLMIKNISTPQCKLCKSIMKDFVSNILTTTDLRLPLLSCRTEQVCPKIRLQYNLTVKDRLRSKEKVLRNQTKSILIKMLR